MAPVKAFLVLGASVFFASTVSALAFSNLTFSAANSNSTSTSLSVPNSNSAATFAAVAAPSALAPPTDLCSTALYHINIHRQNHSSPLATFNQTSVQTAEAAISGCQATMGVLPGQSSAIYYGSGDNPYNAAQVTVQSINLWYSQVDEYSTLTNGFSMAPNTSASDFPSTLAFTQMVWRETTSVGCFAQECGPDTSFTQSLNSEGQTWNWSWNILCVYYPGGNINSPNAFRSNVGAPMGMPSDDPTANLNDATCS